MMSKDGFILLNDLQQSIFPLEWCFRRWELQILPGHVSQDAVISSPVFNVVDKPCVCYALHWIRSSSGNSCPKSAGLVLDRMGSEASCLSHTKCPHIGCRVTYPFSLAVLIFFSHFINTRVEMFWLLMVPFLCKKSHLIALFAEDQDGLHNQQCDRSQLVSFFTM